jgi:hypothetical protein
MTDTLVVGDRGQIIRGTIYKRDDPKDVDDLTGASVRFQMRRSTDKRLMIDRAATIDVAASGEVSYALGMNDTAIPGDYVLEWQVTYPSGRKQTTATLREVTIRRR